MRSLSTATWTSAEPVSVSWRRCSAMISDLGLTIGTSRPSLPGALRSRCPKRGRCTQCDRSWQARDGRGSRAHLLALHIEQQRRTGGLDDDVLGATDLDAWAMYVRAAVQRGHRCD